MNAKELRAKLFAEMQSMTKEEMIRELEDAGYVIRYDLSGHGVLNPDGAPHKRAAIRAVGTYSSPDNSQFTFIKAFAGVRFQSSHLDFGANPSNITYSVQVKWNGNEEVTQWTSHSNPNLLNAS